MIKKYISRLLLTIAAISFIAGCGVLGLEKASTFNERQVYVQSSLNASTASVTAALNNTSISSVDAEKAQGDIKGVQETLNVAVAFHESGDFTQAEDRMKIAEAALTLLRSYLLEKGVH